MTTDDDLREIEAALNEFRMAYYDDMSSDSKTFDRTKERREKLLALIRQKLEGNVAKKPATCQQPAADVAQNDAEHERAVEAWRDSFNEFTVCTGGYECSDEQHARWSAVRDEALRLMRARPVADYVKLHQAAGQMWACLENQAKCGEIQVTTRLRCFMDRFAKVIDEVVDPDDDAEGARPAKPTSDERDAMKAPGVYAIDGRIVGVVDAIATPVGRMVRMSARPASDKVAGELLRAAEHLGYLTGSPGYCGDHEVITLMLDGRSAKEWNQAMHDYLRQKAAERAGIA